MREFVGEVIGTFIMCLFGIGAILTAKVAGEGLGLFEIALAWGVAIALGVYAARGLSNAHLNPAVSFGMCAAGKMPWGKLPVYLAGQYIGAMVSCLCLLALFGGSMPSPTADSEAVALAASAWCSGYGMQVDPLVGSLAEGLGLLVIALVIFTQVEKANAGRPSEALWPVLVGLTFSVTICLVAPFTGASINPARDLVPRITAQLAGFAQNGAVVPADLLVYTVAPIVGALIAGALWRFVLEPLYASKAAE